MKHACPLNDQRMQSSVPKIESENSVGKMRNVCQLRNESITVRQEKRVSLAGVEPILGHSEIRNDNMFVFGSVHMYMGK